MTRRCGKSPVTCELIGIHRGGNDEGTAFKREVAFMGRNWEKSCGNPVWVGNTGGLVWAAHRVCKEGGWDTGLKKCSETYFWRIWNAMLYRWQSIYQLALTYCKPTVGGKSSDLRFRTTTVWQYGQWTKLSNGDMYTDTDRGRRRERRKGKQQVIWVK